MIGLRGLILSLYLLLTFSAVIENGTREVFPTANIIHQLIITKENQNERTAKTHRALVPAFKRAPNVSDIKTPSRLDS